MQFMTYNFIVTIYERVTKMLFLSKIVKDVTKAASKAIKDEIRKFGGDDESYDAESQSLQPADISREPSPPEIDHDFSLPPVLVINDDIEEKMISAMAAQSYPNTRFRKGIPVSNWSDYRNHSTGVLEGYSITGLMIYQTRFSSEDVFIVRTCDFLKDTSGHVIRKANGAERPKAVSTSSVGLSFIDIPSEEWP